MDNMCLYPQKVSLAKFSKGTDWVSLSFPQSFSHE